jgi:hypothetical protein
VKIGGMEKAIAGDEKAISLHPKILNKSDRTLGKLAD